MCDDRNFGPRTMQGCIPINPRDIAKMKRMAHRFMRDFMGDYIHHNIEDLGSKYLISLPLPGRTKKDVKVSLINKYLNISASKPKVPESEKNKEKTEGQAFPFRGFAFSGVNMDVPLPADADENTISSKLANGLLRITIGKKLGKKIDISEEQNN